MSYSITVTVSNGTPTVKLVGTPPDGEYVVGGHSDEFREDISILRKDVEGLLKAHSTSSHSKEV